MLQWQYVTVICFSGIAGWPILAPPRGITLNHRNPRRKWPADPNHITAFTCISTTVYTLHITASYMSCGRGELLLLLYPAESYCNLVRWNYNFLPIVRILVGKPDFERMFSYGRKLRLRCSVQKSFHPDFGEGIQFEGCNLELWKLWARPTNGEFRDETFHLYVFPKIYTIWCTVLETSN